jgi:hypothetical protein
LQTLERETVRYYKNKLEVNDAKLKQMLSVEKDVGLFQQIVEKEKIFLAQDRQRVIEEMRELK